MITSLDQATIEAVKFVHSLLLLEDRILVLLESASLFLNLISSSVSRNINVTCLGGIDVTVTFLFEMY